MNKPSPQSSFTLLEMLIVLGVVSILASVTLLVLKPVELLREGRDSTRIQDLRNIDKATIIGRIQKTSLLDNVAANTVYLSLPDTNGNLSDDCKASGEYSSLPSLESGWAYRCVASSTFLQKTDGTGWIPIDFVSAGGAGFSALPIDPTNNADDGFYYTFSLGTSGTSYSLSANLQSQKYLVQIAATDGGNATSSFETAPIAWTTTTWACGNTLNDSRDGKTYATVLIGSQCWVAQHINYGTMTAGTNNQGSNCPSVAATEKYCYSDTESNCTSDGALYQWAQAMCGAASCNGAGEGSEACATPVQGICPSGWHIPSHYEYVALERAVCASGTCATNFPYDITTTGWRGTNEGTKLKVGGSSGFEGLLAGYRITNGSFGLRGSYAFLWSSLEGGSSAWRRSLSSGDATVYRGASGKLYGFSVRCLKD